jgi:hypothetical protein
VASIAFFIACLFARGYYVDRLDPRAQAEGWKLLVFGWIAIASGTLAWLGNPALFVSWSLLAAKKPGLSLYSAIIGCVFVLTFLFERAVPTGEAPELSLIVGYGMGYWLWLTSAVLQVVASAAALVFSAGHLAVSDAA